MSSRTIFVRACPTCGRSLEIRVELLGRHVECVHCSANFLASEENTRSEDDLRIDRVLARAQQYIDSVTPPNPAATEPR